MIRLAHCVLDSLGQGSGLLSFFALRTLVRVEHVRLNG